MTAAAMRLPLAQLDRLSIRHLLQLGHRVVRFGGLTFEFTRHDVERFVHLLDRQLPTVRADLYVETLVALHRRLELFQSGGVEGHARELQPFATDLLTAFAEHVRRGDADRLLEPDGTHNLAKGPGRCPPHTSRHGRSTPERTPPEPSSGVVLW